MRLKTEIVDGTLQDRSDVRVSQWDNLEHDALAAHALLQAIDEWTMAPAIKQRADELMREWTTSELSSNPR